MTIEYRFIRKPELRKIVGISYETIRKLELAGRFPKRVQVSPRSVAWISTDVEEWMDAKRSGLDYHR